MRIEKLGHEGNRVFNGEWNPLPSPDLVNAVNVDSIIFLYVWPEGPETIDTELPDWPQFKVQYHVKWDGEEGIYWIDEEGNPYYNRVANVEMGGAKYIKKAGWGTRLNLNAGHNAISGRHTVEIWATCEDDTGHVAESAHVGPFVVD